MGDEASAGGSQPGIQEQRLAPMCMDPREDRGSAGGLRRQNPGRTACEPRRDTQQSRAHDLLQQLQKRQAAAPIPAPHLPSLGQ